MAIPPADVAADIRLRRRVLLGGKGRRPAKPPKKRLPRQRIGPGLWGAYAKQLKKLVDEAREALGPLFDELPLLLATAKRERRVDVGEGTRITQLIDLARRRVRTTRSLNNVEELARQFAERTSTAQRIQLNRQLRSGLGVELFVPDSRLAVLADGFVAKNVSLIRDIPQKVISDVESTVTEALTGGKLRGDIAAELQKKFKIGKRRAELIARDQIGKFHGQLNATRQQEIGVKRFVWWSVNDERVRDEHEDRHGVMYEYANPPNGELPGEPINCRCYAEPVLDDILNA